MLDSRTVTVPRATPTEEFEAHRGRLRALAYRMLGSASEADDIVQEAWLRWREARDVEVPRAWLTTVVTRLCLDQLGSARVRREAYVGPWLPEPLDTSAEEPIDPESVSLAVLLLLERLTPAERAVYLLHRVFDLDHAEIAATLGKSEAAVRQLHHRATAHVQAERPRFAPSREEHRRLLGGFLAAIQAGELSRVEALLAEDARSWNDGGGRARAALKVVQGRSRVARLFVGLMGKSDAAQLDAEIRDVNGWPALVLWGPAGSDGGADHPELVLALETDGTVIHAVHVVRNPEKLGALRRLD